MKKITFLMFTMLLTWYSNAQCIRTTEFGNIVSNNSGNFQSVTTCAYSTAEYSVVSGLTVTGNYQFTAQTGATAGVGAHIYLTVTDASNNVIQHGVSPLTVNAITVGTVRLHYSENATCAGLAECKNAQVKYLTDCVVPAGLTSSNVTATTATISWVAPTPAPADGYDYYVSTTNTAPTATTVPTGSTVAGTTTVSLTTLPSATQHYFWVRSKCGTATTVWSASATFTTQCVPFVPAYTQNFATFVPSCWTTAGAGSPATGPTDATAGIWTSDGFLNSGATGAIKVNLYYINRTGWIISPILDLSAGNYRVKFDVGATAWNATTATTMGSDDVVSLLISNDGGTTWTAIQTFTANNTPSNATNSISIPLTANVSPTTKFAFYATDGTVDDTQDYDFFIDNFAVESIPACTDPTGVTVTNVTTTSATVSWTAPTPAPAQGYQYYLSTSSTPPVAGSAATITGSPTTNTVNLTNLPHSTVHYVWVRSNCGSETSPWTNVVTFTTSCGASTAPLAPQTFATFLPLCWSQAKGALSTSSTLTGTTSVWASSTAFANATGTNKGVKINLYGGTTATPDNDWIITNSIDLGTIASQFRIKYRMAVTGYNATNAQTTLGTHTVKVVVSTDNGATWSTANVIKTYTGAGTYSNTSQDEIVELAGFSGVVKIGFLATTTSTSPDIDFHIDDFAVETSLATASFDFSKLSAYPNPVKNVLNLSYSQDISDVAVFNLLGQQVLAKKVNATESQIDMSNLTQGTYLVKVTVENQVKTIKVIKE